MAPQSDEINSFLSRLQISDMQSQSKKEKRWLKETIELKFCQSKIVATDCFHINFEIQQETNFSLPHILLTKTSLTVMIFW